MNVKINACTFKNNKGSTSLFNSMETTKLIDYFPPGYFESSMSPLLNILLNPPSKVRNDKLFSFSITSSTFQSNRNFQV